MLVPLLKFQTVLHLFIYIPILGNVGIIAWKPLLVKLNLIVLPLAALPNSHLGWKRSLSFPDKGVEYPLDGETDALVQFDCIVIRLGDGQRKMFVVPAP